MKTTACRVDTNSRLAKMPDQENAYEPKKLCCLCPKIEYFGISVPFCYHMGRERVFSEKKSPITSVKLFGMEKVSGITKKNFKIGTLGDFEKTYVLYVAMAEKPLSSGQKWFLR